MVDKNIIRAKKRLTFWTGKLDAPTEELRIIESLIEQIESQQSLDVYDMYVKSGTSGNKLPAKIIKKSRWRKLFFIPDNLVEYVGTDSKGLRVSTMWMYEADIFGG